MSVLVSSRSGVVVDVRGAGTGLRLDMGDALFFAGESMSARLQRVASGVYWKKKTRERKCIVFVAELVIADTVIRRGTQGLDKCHLRLALTS